jgi:hypothetical protein
MPPETSAPGSPTDWMRHAYSDLALAGITPSRKFCLNNSAFTPSRQPKRLSKQSWSPAPSRLPAHITSEHFFDLLPAEVTVPSDIQEGAGLSDYAVASRYPGASEPVEAEEYREAVDMAEAVVYWAEQVIHHRLQDAADSTPMAEDTLQMRAHRGDRATFEAAMAKVPDVEPEDDDRL